MLKAKELMRISDARDDWKHLKLWSWAYAYEKKVEELYGRPEYRLVFEWMDEIPPDENGKMRCFICSL